MKKLLFILMIGSLFANNLPSQSDIIKMTHEEKMNLYENNKMTILESFFDLQIGISSSHRNKKIYSGIILSYSPFIIGALTNKWNQESVYFAAIGSYTIIGMIIYDVQKQRKLYNDKLYEEIFIINQ